MQKMIRLDQEYAALEQGSLSHADFRALFESKLQDMMESGMHMPSEETLFRNYLTKLTPDVRARVLSKDWRINEGEQARQPKTHKELAKVVGMCLEGRADIHATGQVYYDSLMGVEGVGVTIPRAKHTAKAGRGGGPPGPENLANAGGGPRGATIQCSYCHMIDNHLTSSCPQKAAGIRNDSAHCHARAITHSTKLSLIHI